MNDTKQHSSEKTSGHTTTEQNLTALIDDSIEFAESCNALGIPTLIFDTPWNKEKPIPLLSRRIARWRDALPAIKTFF